MRSLRTQLRKLLVEIESDFKPEIRIRERWKATSPTQGELTSFVHDAESIAWAIPQYEKRLEANSATFKSAKSLYYSDSVFSAGYALHANQLSFETVLWTYIKMNSAVLKRGIKIDKRKVLNQISRLREDLDFKRPVKAKVSAIGINLKLACKQIRLKDGVRLYRLTREESNNRQEPLDPIFSSYPMSSSLMHENTELQITLTNSIDYQHPTPILKATQAVHRDAKAKLQCVIDAIEIALSCRATLGNLSSLSNFPMFYHGGKSVLQFSPRVNDKIRSADAKNIASIYDILSGRTATDKTLLSSMHRFSIGIKRKLENDRTVDFVIAWEAILLTVNGSSQSSELSYRFSMNAGALLAEVNSSRSQKSYFENMKTAYKVRSCIVHGEDNQKLQRILSNSNFTSLYELSKFLEDNYRKTLFWLLSKRMNQRPYMKNSGWESLIWKV